MGFPSQRWEVGHINLISNSIKLGPSEARNRSAGQRAYAQIHRWFLQDHYNYYSLIYAYVFQFISSN